MRNRTKTREGTPEELLDLREQYEITDGVKFWIEKTGVSSMHQGDHYFKEDKKSAKVPILLLPQKRI